MTRTDEVEPQGTRVLSDVVQKKNMKLETRYLLAGLMISCGCMSWYLWSTSNPLGTILICFHSIFTQPSQYTEKIKLGFPKWNPRSFFPFIAFLTLLAVVIILIANLSEGRFDELLQTWYFIGLVWLGLISSLLTGYYKKKHNQQVDPTVKTPVESGNEQGTQAHF